MQAEHPSPETLQRFFDAELTPGESASAKAHVASCQACSAQLASLRRLHELVVMAADDTTHAANFDAMFARIERGIDDPAPASNDATVSPLQSRRVRHLLNAGPALGALALAAAVLLMVYRRDTSQTPATEEPYEVSVAHSEVVEVDFGANAGTVFDILLADGSSNPVVWIDDDGESEQPSSKAQE